MTLLIGLLGLLLILVIVLLVAQYLAGRRQRLLTRILDLADELEALLQQTRKQMDSMQAVVERVPSDIGAVASASLRSQEQIQQGLRNVLEHRLWLAQNAASASLAELKAACAALLRSRSAIAEQLQRLDSAGAELAEVTNAAVAQAQREPASLRRAPNDDGSAAPE